LADEIAILRGRIAAYFHILMNEREAQILARFAYRLAAAGLCCSEAETDAMREALLRQRNAELAALRLTIGSERQTVEKGDVAALRAARRSARPSASAASTRSGYQRRRLQRRFQRARTEVTRPAPETKRAPGGARPVRIVCSAISPSPGD
jgi:hypothetical protein